MKLFNLGMMMTALFGSLSGDLHFADCRDPVLEKRAIPLTPDQIQDQDMQNLFDALLKLAKGEQGDQYKSVLVGLAAPQVGYSIRVILVDVKADGKGGVSELRLYINPEIVEMSEETEEWYEGCYSTGTLRAVVSRPRHVKIKALDREGHAIIESYSGYVARIFQHEIDHLNGIRFPERVPQDGNLHIVKENESFEYRNMEQWRTWKNTLPQKEWRSYLQLE